MRASFVLVDRLRDARAGGTHVASLLDEVSISSSWIVSSIELMESNVSARGAHYTVVDSFKLTGERQLCSVA
jgi:hypothetical protein